MINLRTFVKKSLTQALGIMAVTFTLAMVVNVLRSDGLPLFQGPTVSTTAQNLSEIALDESAKLFAANRAIFVDARSQFEYEQGHIQGAVLLPPEDFLSRFHTLQTSLRSQSTIIVYCDGEACRLSHETAEKLKAQGLTQVRVLQNGWSLWQLERLPVATGAMP